MAIGVGFLGAGPAVQAIHLPTLARLGDTFDVTAVMDVDPTVAEAIAGRAQARPTTSAEDLLADPAVEVVAVCSPSQFHAPQVIAAIDAGKRAILCEKPFATSREEAEMLADVSRRSGVPIIVGAMHTFDPAWTWAGPKLQKLDEVRKVRSRIILPPNARFEELATEIHSRGTMPPSSFADPAARATRLRGGILGLAIHDLPLIRRVAPRVDRVLHARPLAPSGYLITYLSGDTIVELIAQVHRHWKQEWTLEVWTADADARLDFAPSYVHAGSGTALISQNLDSVSFSAVASDGYLQEWEHLASLCNGAAQPRAELDDAIADVEYALHVADAVAEHVLAVAA